MSERLSRRVGSMAGRLADLLLSGMPEPQGRAAQGLNFLRVMQASAPPENGGSGVEPLDRIVEAYWLSALETDLLILAGMPEEHEGIAAVLASIHPTGEPRPSVGLAAQLMSKTPAERQELRRHVETSRLAASGILQVTGNGPFFNRSLQLMDSLWPVLHAVDAWPEGVQPVRTPPCSFGLDEWLETPEARAARDAITAQEPCYVVLTADSETAAMHRAIALVSAAGRTPAAFPFPATATAAYCRRILAHALARGMVPVLALTLPEGPLPAEPPRVEDWPGTIVLSGRTGAASFRGDRPLLPVPHARLTPVAQRRVWALALPELADSADYLAARYPVEPVVAAEAAADLRLARKYAGEEPLSTGAVAEAVRARSRLLLSGGVQLIRPTAGWDRLVLPQHHESQLREAVKRLELQARVLDEWGFLQGRSGARGVRMLFSGPPGTGKTLAAEVLASELKVDLLLVDISRVVSKWIGETEKHLAATFDAAERSRSALFFDEADALFGRRTEISDAHDRYANLETAYLLARLERFDGLAILATNLRQNIDPAFLRRMEFVIDFEEPGSEERHRMWRCHIPDEGMLDGDVNLYELASLYPVTGGIIRNAATAAAFLAAADGQPISRIHFMRAIRREYEKAGKAFPGLPRGVKVS